METTGEDSMSVSASLHQKEREYAKSSNDNSSTITSTSNAREHCGENGNSSTGVSGKEHGDNSDMIQLRIRRADGIRSVFINRRSPGSDILNQVAKGLGIEPSNIESIRYGFPLKNLDLTSSSPLVPLAAEGETLIIVSKDEVGKRAASSKAACRLNSRAHAKLNVTSAANSKCVGGRVQRSVSGGLPSNVRTLGSNSGTKRRRSSTLKTDEEECWSSATPSEIEYGTSPVRYSNGVGTKRRSVRRRGLNLGESEEEVAESLVQIMTSKGRRSAGDNALRRVFSKSLKSRYDETAAERRWAVVAGGAFRIEDGPFLRISYQADEGRREIIEEKHLAMPRQLVITILQRVWNSGDETSRRNLKPYYLCQAQPAVFWNIVNHFGSRFDLCFESFLSREEVDTIFDRQRTLSQKALENLRQNEEVEAEKMAARLHKAESRKCGGSIKDTTKETDNPV